MHDNNHWFTFAIDLIYYQKPRKYLVKDKFVQNTKYANLNCLHTHNNNTANRLATSFW